MNNEPIEDIVINSYKSTKKKGSGIIGFLFFFFLLLLIFACVGYWYLTRNTVVPSKQQFFSAILGTDYEFFIENEVFNEIINKYTKNNSETEAKMTFSTTNKQSEEFADVDISKFVLDVNFINNISTEETFGELNLSYSDNDLIKLKLINNKNQIAWTSDEIVNKYVAINKENSEKVLAQVKKSIEENQTISDGENTDSIQEESNFLPNDNLQINDILKFSNSPSMISKKQIGLDKNGKSEKIKEYLNYISNSISEEKFSMQSNFALERDNNENISVTAYTLKLTQQEYLALAKNVLIKLKQDESLIKEFITGQTAKKQTELDLTQNANLNPVGTNNENVENTNTVVEENEENNTQNDENIIAQETESSVNIETTENVVAEENIEQENEEQTENKVQTNITVTPIVDNESEETNVVKTPNLIDLQKFFISILLNRKFEATADEVKNSIDYYLETLKNDGNGLQVTVYVSDKNTEKINVILPNSATMDFEFYNKSDNEKNVIMTYLTEEEVIKYDDNNAVVYSAFDNTVSEVVPSGTEKQINGFKLEFNKLKKEASTRIKLIYNFIENKEINKKISVNIVTDGTTSAKNFENEFIIVYSTKEGELKATIENKIKFGVNKTVEILTPENSIVLDTLADEELKINIDAIRDKVKTVYDAKKESLKFIDTNTQTSLIQNTVFVTRDEARNLLITTISNQMGEAQNKGEEYTLNNIKNLEITGHQVNVVFENELARVTVDGYKFEIDSNFNLSDV